MSIHGADSEVGRLETVLLHRPGNELKRLTPRNNDKLLFDGIPWVARAQEEHDGFAQALRDRGVEVLYLTDLLTETLVDPDAREVAVHGVTSTMHLGDTMASYLRGFLGDLPPDDLALVLTAGVRNDEVRGGFGLVTSLLAHDEVEHLDAPRPQRHGERVVLLLRTADPRDAVEEQLVVVARGEPLQLRTRSVEHHGLERADLAVDTVHGGHGREPRPRGGWRAPASPAQPASSSYAERPASTRQTVAPA